MLNLLRSIAFAGLLLVLLVPAQSQQPSPSDTEAAGQNKSPRTENQKQTESDQRGTEKLPFVVKIIGAEPETQNGANTPKNKNGNDPTDWPMFFATVGIGFIGFLQFIAFIVQANY